MTPNPGKKQRRLADMGVEPARFKFERRDEAELILDSPIPLSPEGDHLHLRQWCYRGKIVDFAIMQYLTPSHPDNSGSDGNSDVARIDTSHSEVHKHQYFRDGREQVRSVIKSLQDADSLEHAEEMIDACFDACNDDMSEHWVDHLDTWRGDTP